MFDVTLVLSSINASFVVQASDRLTTRWQGERLLGAHDPLANKTVVYLAFDGPMAISYSGPAYVGVEPTDDWIARQLAGVAPPRMEDGRFFTTSFQRLPLRTFNQAAWLLQQAISAEPAFSVGLEVAIAGWRVRRHRLAQVLLLIVRDTNGTSRRGHMRLLTEGSGEVFASVGADFEIEEMLATARNVADRRALALNASTRSDFLADTVRRTSRANRAVGADVMLVEMPRWGPNEGHVVTIRYSPATRRYLAVLSAGPSVQVQAAFWPWVVTPGGMRAPCFSTGDGGSFHACGWEFKFEAPTVAPPGNGVLFAESSLGRPSPQRPRSL